MHIWYRRLVAYNIIQDPSIHFLIRYHVQVSDAMLLEVPCPTDEHLSVLLTPPHKCICDSAAFSHPQTIYYRCFSYGRARAAFGNSHSTTFGARSTTDFPAFPVLEDLSAPLWLDNHSFVDLALQTALASGFTFQSYNCFVNILAGSG